MFSLCDLYFVLGLHVPNAQRIIGFFILITHKSTRSEKPITWLLINQTFTWQRGWIWFVVLKWVSTKGDFRVAFRLIFKASPSAKPFIWKQDCFVLLQIHMPQAFERGSPEARGKADGLIGYSVEGIQKTWKVKSSQYKSLCSFLFVVLTLEFWTISLGVSSGNGRTCRKGLVSSDRNGQLHSEEDQRCATHCQNYSCL